MDVRKETLVQLTTPSLDLICLMWSRENVIVEITIGLNWTSSSPDRIGERESSTKLLFRRLHPKSEIVLKIEPIHFGTVIFNLLKLQSGFEGNWSEGNVKEREGLSALCRQERRAPMREKPSPSAWWSLKMIFPAALLVGYFTRWISHKGWLWGNCFRAILDI